MKIWSLSTGKCLQTLEGHTHRVNSVIYLQDKDQIVSGSSDRTLKIWSLSTGQCLQTLHGHTDGRALESRKEQQMNRNQLHQCKLLKNFQRHTSSVNSVIYLHDKDQLVSGNSDNTLKIWSATTGECLQTLQGHKDWVRSVIYLHDKDQVVSGSDDKTLKIWSLSTGKCLQTLQGHWSDVNSVIYLHDKDQLVSGSRDKTLKIWSLSTGQCQTLHGHKV